MHEIEFLKEHSLAAVTIFLFLMGILILFGFYLVFKNWREDKPRPRIGWPR